jgi:hypothetical protein
VRAYNLGKLMRQAKPDDVSTFVMLREIEEHLPRSNPTLDGVARSGSGSRPLLATEARRDRRRRGSFPSSVMVLSGVGVGSGVPDA